LPRLKHAVEPIKIIKWLENFDKDEVDAAIDLLRICLLYTSDAADDLTLGELGGAGIYK